MGGRADPPSEFVVKDHVVSDDGGSQVEVGDLGVHAHFVTNHVVVRREQTSTLHACR